MAKPLTYQPLPDYGVNGLNTQRNPSTLDASWLTTANNVVVRESGRIAFRKGFKQKVAPNTESGGTAIGSIVEHNDQGTNKIFASYGTSIYTIDFTTPNAAFPSSGADVKRTVANSSGNWQFVNFNDRLHCFHAGVVPQRYDGSLGSGVKWIAHATDPASIATLFDPSCGMGYYGRIWCGGVAEAKDVVYYSNLLDGDDWTGGDTGLIDLSKVWDNDEVVALAAFYGKLIIFGKNNIVIYNSPEIVGSLAVDEVIKGIGCVSRDSVQAIGDDLVFLSATGLRSLARTTEKDKLPLTDLSVNIKDTLIRNIGQSTNVKSVYVENEGIYIMSFVDKNINYVFDFKHITPNEVPRVTTWTFDNDREPASMAYTELYSGLLVGQKDGSIAGYEGYFDADLAGASTYTNASFTSEIASGWIPLGETVSSALLKRMILVLEGGSGATLGLKWYKDFSFTSSATTHIALQPATTGSTALWGAATSLYGCSTTTDYGGVTYCTIGQHNTQAECTAGGGTWTTISNTGGVDQPPNCTSSPAYYTPIYGLQEYTTPLTGSAKHLKLNIAIESNGYDTMIQNLTLLHKEGKIR